MGEGSLTIEPTTLFSFMLLSPSSFPRPRNGHHPQVRGSTLHAAPYPGGLMMAHTSLGQLHVVSVKKNLAETATQQKPAHAARSLWGWTRFQLLGNAFGRLIAAETPSADCASSADKAGAAMLGTCCDCHPLVSSLAPREAASLGLFSLNVTLSIFGVVPAPGRATVNDDLQRVAAGVQLL